MSTPRNADDGTAVLYLRISKDKLGLALGVDRQEEACRALCSRMGWTISQVYRDNDVSATSSRKRPAFEQMLKDRPNRIVMWSVDRLVRRGPDLERLIELDIPVHSDMAGPMDLSAASGRLNARLLTSVATFEGEIKAERQVAAAQQRAKMGKSAWAHRPFGLTHDGTLHPVEANYLRQCYERFLAGESVSSLARWLGREGITTTREGAWSGQTLSRCMKSARNAGILVYKGQEIGPGKWEAVVSEATYRAAMQRFADPKRKSGGAGKRRFLLTGLARCGACGGSVKGGTLARSGPYKGEPMYQCSAGCLALPVSWTDGRVLLALPETLEDPAMRQFWQHMDETGTEQQRSLMTERHRLESVLETLSTDYVAGLIDRAQMIAGTERARARVAEIDDDLATLGQGVPMDGHVWDVEYVMGELGDMDADELRELLGAVTSSVTLHRRGKGQRGLRPDLVQVEPKRVT